MNFNFFSWIRLGVKQSVLMGVSDAVESLGTPHENDDVQQRLMSFVQVEGPAAAAKLAGPAPASRRKLGRTLTDIQAGTGKAQG